MLERPADPIKKALASGFDSVCSINSDGSLNPPRDMEGLKTAGFNGIADATQWCGNLRRQECSPSQSC